MRKRRAVTLYLHCLSCWVNYNSQHSLLFYGTQFVLTCTFVYRASVLPLHRVQQIDPWAVLLRLRRPHRIWSLPLLFLSLAFGSKLCPTLYVRVCMSAELTVVLEWLTTQHRLRSPANLGVGEVLLSLRVLLREKVRTLTVLFVIFQRLHWNAWSEWFRS